MNVNAALLGPIVRRVLQGPQRFAVTLTILLVPLLGEAAARDGRLPLPGMSMYLVYAVGAGALGADLRSGALLSVLVRPVTRARIVLARWLGITGIVLGLAAAQHVVAFVLIAARSDVLPDGAELATNLGTHASVAAGCCAVLLLFSAVLPGLGDVAILAVLMIGHALTLEAGRLSDSAEMVRTALFVRDVINPALDTSPFFTAAPVSLHAVLKYASTVVVALALAILTLNARQISPGRAGD